MRIPRFLPSLLFTTVLCLSSLPVSAQPTHSSIDVADLRRHVEYLAGDALEGRFMGSTGNRAAAEYIAAAFQRFGLVPAGENATWFQLFEVVTGMSVSGKNELRIRIGKKTLGLVSGKDFSPYGLSASESTSGDLVFVGYGISSEKAHYNDYAGRMVKGKIVVLLNGFPSLPDKADALMEQASLRAKALAAREAGAVGMLIVHPVQEDAARLKYDGSAAHAGIVVLSLSHRGFAKLLNLDPGKVKDLLARYESTRDSSLISLDGLSASMTAAVTPLRARIPNVLGLLEGSDPALRDSVVVIGAHFDHLGLQHESSLSRSGKPEVHNGADDNASGVAGMLELAEYFAAHRPRHSLLFMGFNAEESGLLGSSAWTKNPTIPLARVRAMLNLDMIGRYDAQKKRLNIQGTGTAALWESLITKINASYAFDLALIKDGRGSSDHSSFNAKNIPVLFFFTGLHTDYHRPSDDVDKINFAGQETVTRFVADLIAALDTAPVLPVYVTVNTGNEPRMRSFNVYVGTIPDYGSTDQGFRISGTSPGSPAEKAGLKANDLIVRFGETKILSIYDYMNALSKHTPGEDVPVTVQRDGKDLILTVHLEKK